MKKIILFFALLLPIVNVAQSYTVDWYKIAGGGGTSTSGTYSMTGTIGQPDASIAMSGGNYSLTGGFWSIIAVVQSAGVPNLIIVPNGPNSVNILWPNTGTYTLLQTANLADDNSWTTNTSPLTTANGTNSITVTPSAGNLFFACSSDLIPTAIEIKNGSFGQTAGR